MLRPTLLAALLALSGASAFATDYFVVVPVKNKTVNLSAISVALNASAMPGAKVGYAFSYDFKSNLQVTGDATYTGYGVSWAVTAGSLPAGLSLNTSTGVLSGTPTTAGSSNFTVAATYKTKPGSQPYTVVVANVQAVVALQANTDTNFGTVTVGNSVSKSFTVTNSGDGPATGVYARVNGADLALTANTCGTAGSQQTLAANNGTCAVTVRYTPTDASTLSAALNLFVGNVAGSPFSLALSGSSVFPYPLASGGSVTNPGDGYQYHAYTATGANTFTVTSAAGQDFDILVVAGGGGGGQGKSGTQNPGGGGAGGLLFQTVKLTAGTYNLSVGAGGATTGSGTDSQFTGTGVTLTAVGGGAGGGNTGGAGPGGAGGSGGGGAGSGTTGTTRSGGSATAGQGNAGGVGQGTGQGGGGGGAGSAGVGGVGGVGAGVGGAGRYIAQFASFGVSGYFAGGGGGGDCGGKVGGTGGGGTASTGGTGTAGTANTGGGGGAGCASGNAAGGAGGTGVVLIRYAKP